jgi:3-dehydroquinate synthase
MSDVTTITVPGVDSYDVLVGRGILESIPAALGRGVAKVLVVHPPTLGAKANALRDLLQDHGYETLLAEVPDAEDAKRVEVAAFCWQIMGQTDFTL